MTVNKALTQLAKAGLIERKRKSGSFVSFPRSQAAILEIHDIRDEVAALGAPYRFELLKRWDRLSGPADAQKIDIPRHTQIIDLVCRHHAGQRVFALEERIINLDAVPDAAAADFSEHSPGPVHSTLFAPQLPRRKMLHCSILRRVHPVWSLNARLGMPICQ
jgi:GntR family histidine utilization transcriptional repressor